jgi:hypothetical protein
MRHLVLIAACLTLPSSALADPRREAPARTFGATGAERLDCIVNRVEHAAPRQPLRPRTLDELPPGTLYHAVERQLDGCRELVLVSEERARSTQRR